MKRFYTRIIILFIAAALAFTNGLQAAVQTFTVNGVTFKMVVVEGGTFTMGATAEQGNDAWGDELPTHQVTLSGYMIGQTEVTQALWQAVMGNNPSYHTGNLNYPVECVSFWDVQNFFIELRRLTGLNFRFVYEAEWEYAARGGKLSKGYKYSGSNTIGDIAWYNANSSGATHAVATKAANELGIYDMSGNVSEIVFDFPDDYSSEPQTNPTGPLSGSGHVYRGGNYKGSASNCRVSYRSYTSSSDANQTMGFRLASPIFATGVTLNKTSATLNTGQTLQLSATVAPSNATDKSVSWTTSNSSVASVNSNGLVTAIASGTATISVTAKDGSEKSASCSVTVIELVDSIGFDKTSLVLYNDETATITATVFPETANNRKLMWSSSNTSVATVSSSGSVATAR